jgi:serine/threonine protein kinase
MSATTRTAKEIFMAAVKLPAEQRDAFLDQACAGDPDLRRRVSELLRAHQEIGSFLEKPAVEQPVTGAYRPAPDDAGPADPVAPLPITEGPGTRIGPYKLLQQIGEGGMGVVYMAEQEHPVRRRVALKIIKPGMDSTQVVARFEAERQALAMMDHINIAKVLDAGATDTGRPFFVMELVHGIPITRYCDDNHLTPRERLELFVPVCQAIQHAHQKGIIHRDIKPSNVLVTLYDGKPVPKIIDFGVAKATEQRLTEKTMFTQYGTMVGTLEYMSPEQAEMSALGVDTRSDIYSLGVLLYELLTGTTPLSRQRLREAAFDEVLRLIREEEPPRPSTRLSETGRQLTSISAHRKTEPAKLAKLLRGELDWIVMKALEKDRARRYETANGFARDIQRYLADEPVEACPPSVGYRLRKFARKYRMALRVAGGFALLLCLGAAFSAWQAVRATVAEGRALAERDAKDQALQEAKAVLAFFQEKVLAAGRPKGDEGGGLGKDVTLRQAVVAAESRVAESFPDQPLVEASIRDVLGRTYYLLGELQSAIAQHKRALALRQAKLGADHKGTLTSMLHLGEAYGAADMFDQAVPLCEETLKRMKAKLGPNHIDTLRIMAILASWYTEEGKFDQALSLMQETLQRRKATLGPNHIRTLAAMYILAKVYKAAGKTGRALDLFKETIEGMKANPEMGPEHRYTLKAMNGLAGTYLEAGELDLAMNLFQETLARRTALLGLEHPETISTMHDFSRCLLRAGKSEKAEALLRDCLKLREKNQPDHWKTFDTKSELGGALVGQQKYAEAEPLLRDGYEGMKQREVTIPTIFKVRLTEALERLVRLYDTWDKKDKADVLRKKLKAIKGSKKE